MAAALGDVLNAVTATAQAVFGAAACSIAVVDEDSETLEFVAASGAGRDQVIGLRIPSSKGIAGWAVTTGQAMAISDVQRDARFDRDAAEQTGYVPTVILAAPAIHDGEALGVIEVLDPGTSTEGERSLELLGRFADLAALIVAGMSAPSTARLAEQDALLAAAMDYARSQGLR